MKPKTIFLVLLAVLGITGGFVVYAFLNPPDFSQLRNKVQVNIRMTDGASSKRWVGPSAGDWVSLSEISENLVLAVIATEDTTFFQHQGFDPHEIHQAIKTDIQRGKYARGASTITQQLVKNVYLTSEKALWRKIKEVAWAYQLDQVLSKREILAFYLNLVEWGPGIYGIGEASSHYFGKEAAYLSVRESAFLAMLLPSPRKYHQYYVKRELSPWAQKRLDQILATMLRLNFINQPTYENAIASTLWE